MENLVELVTNKIGAMIAENQFKSLEQQFRFRFHTEKHTANLNYVLKFLLDVHEQERALGHISSSLETISLRSNCEHRYRIKKREPIKQKAQQV